MPYQRSFPFYTLYKESKRAGLTITSKQRNAQGGLTRALGIYLIL